MVCILFQNKFVRLYLKRFQFQFAILFGIVYSLSLRVFETRSGHVNGTTRKNKWMDGAIVHVEHLERPNHLPRSMVESYRIPSILDFARVRLHVGPAAPTT